MDDETKPIVKVCLIYSRARAASPIRMNAIMIVLPSVKSTELEVSVRLIRGTMPLFYVRLFSCCQLRYVKIAVKQTYLKTYFANVV